MTDNNDPTAEGSAAPEEQPEQAAEQGRTEAPEGVEDVITRIGVMTPMGPLPLSALPRELLLSIKGGIDSDELDSLGVPEEARAQFLKELDEAIEGADEESASDVFHQQEEAFAAATAPREGQRERLWAILDEAFPNDPHLWSAAEALFMASELGPDMDDHGRFHVLEAAHAHLDRRIALLSAQAEQADPIESLLAQFRDEMDHRGAGQD